MDDAERRIVVRLAFEVSTSLSPFSTEFRFPRYMRTRSKTFLGADLSWAVAFGGMIARWTFLVSCAQGFVKLASAQSVGINFLSTRDPAAELAPAESAGHPDVAQANWNNTNGGANGTEANMRSPSFGELVDSTGAASGVTMTWAANTTWNTSNGSGSPDAKLMNGYIDNSNNLGTGFATVDFANISYPKFDVYVYFGSDVSNRTGWVESTTAGEAYSYSTSSNIPGGGFDPESDYILTQDQANAHPPSNYCVFRDQMSSTFSVQINRGLQVSRNSGIHGIQIVSKEPPGGCPRCLPTIGVTKVKGSSVSLILDIPRDAVRARVTQSPNLRDWELTQILPTGGDQWMERPEAGWGGPRDLTVTAEGQHRFFRLEIER